jgi:hypothetical protein
MSFYVTLPSNVLTSEYKNTQSNYTTQFPVPLSFNVQYEVALVEFTYREYMSNDIGNIYVRWGIDTDFRPFPLKAFDNEPVQHFIDRIQDEINEYYTKIEYLASKQTVFKFQDNIKLFNSYSINHQDPEYTKTFNLTTAKLPVFEIRNDREISINIPDGTFVKFDGYASELFQARVETKSLIHKFVMNSELLNFFDYLMVYTDIIEPQLVGNTRSELLQCVTKTGFFNRTTEKIFTNPHYIPVNRCFINNININVRTPNGEYARFESATSKVLVKLHFRPIKNA